MPLADWLPARYDISQADYNPEIGRRLLIKLDGIKQDMVLAYDAEQGWLIRYRTDENGQIIIDREHDRAKQETVYGVVTIDWRD